MTAATAATVATARAVVSLMSRSATTQLLAPVLDKRIIVAVSGREPLGYREGCDGFIAGQEPRPSGDLPQVPEMDRNGHVGAADLQRHGIFVDRECHSGPPSRWEVGKTGD